jgi:small conductance mechanosensitive channel
MPVGFTSVDEAAEVLRTAADELAHDEEYADDLIEPPQVLGVEQITAEGAVLRTTVKTNSEAQWRVARELRRRLTEALHAAGIAARITTGRVYLQAAGVVDPAGGPAGGAVGGAGAGPAGDVPVRGARAPETGQAGPT